MRRLSLRSQLRRLQNIARLFQTLAVNPSMRAGALSMREIRNRLFRSETRQPFERRDALRLFETNRGGKRWRWQGGFGCRRRATDLVNSRVKFNPGCRPEPDSGAPNEWIALRVAKVLRTRQGGEPCKYLALQRSHSKTGFLRPHNPNQF